MSGRLRVAQFLRLGQNIIEITAGFSHRRQDVVTGAVENSVDAENSIAGEPFPQRLYDRNTSSHRGFVT